MVSCKNNSDRYFNAHWLYVSSGGWGGALLKSEASISIGPRQRLNARKFGGKLIVKKILGNLIDDIIFLPECWQSNQP